MIQPGPKHHIEIEPAEDWVRVLWGQHEVASTGRALVLREGSYAPVFYIPRDDARMELFEPTPRRTTCPYKGQASYFSLASADGKRDENAVWSYEQPDPAVAAIAGHLAFYADRVVILVEPPAEDVPPDPPE
ncbi:MAG: DUF427 domain-containing protein [Beijerinckiaceae bacterium]|nr:DUF427 domain-containing protein [Beijerinckiaceae bacterium]